MDKLKSVTDLFIDRELTANHNSLINHSHAFPQVEFPSYDKDCEFTEQCKYTTESCYAGERITINGRCSNERINNMLDNKDLKPTQQINIHESKNVQVNQQGDNAVSTQTQTLTIEQLPTELIDQFKELVMHPNENNRKGWVTFLESFSSVGGTISTLVSLFNLFTSGG